MKTTRRTLFRMAAAVPLAVHARPRPQAAPPMRPWQTGLGANSSAFYSSEDLEWFAGRWDLSTSGCANLFLLREDSTEGHYFASLYGDSQADVWFLRELLFEPIDAKVRSDCEVYWLAPAPRGWQLGALRQAGLRLRENDLAYIGVRHGLTWSWCANEFRLREDSPEGHYFACLYGDSDADAWFLHEILYEPHEALVRGDFTTFWVSSVSAKGKRAAARGIGINEAR